MESMTRMEHVLDHAKLCGLSSKQAFETFRPAYNVQHTDQGFLEADSANLQKVSLKLSYSLHPWPMPGLTSCVLWTGGFLRTFQLLSQSQQPPAQGQPPIPCCCCPPL